MNTRPHLHRNVPDLALAALLLAASVASTATAQVIEGAFGRAEFSPSAPGLTRLVLRKSDGALEAQSLLSPADKPWLRGVPDWGTGGYTYVVDTSGRRYESRAVAAEQVEEKANVLRVLGVRLTAAAAEPPVAREDWTLESTDEGLRWTVERTWLRDFECRLAGTPALFFSHRPWQSTPSTILENCTATTLWIAPEFLRAQFEPLYRPAAFHDGYKLSRNNALWVTKRGAWAIAKLWTNWPHERDLRCAADDAFLYRRGFLGWIGELGANSETEWPRGFHAGKKERGVLTLGAVAARESGHQLQVHISDERTAAALRNFYGALLNGGCVNDPVNYGFGNEVDGWDYAGSAWMKGFALLAGAPAPEPLASQPHPLPLAFRGHLARILGTIGADGRTRFGYNFSGDFVDDNLHTVIGCCAYLLYSGDTAFIRQQLPALERLLDGFIARRNADGLYDGGAVQHWYYDAMPSSGVNTYHNTFFYNALLDLAQMERAAGSAEKAARYDQLAADVKAAINRVLWWEDAADGARYCDWISDKGERVSYAADVCQWPPLALGIASPEQARKVVATLDRRTAELEKEHGYTGAASVSAYWPVPAHINTHPANQGFGNYMNGGSFLAQTYWEIVGRARAGDATGAWRRLQRFAEGAARQGWCGNNWFTMRGEIGHGACDEPYLSDMVVVPAALVQGLLGIRPNWEKLEVQPSLPADWHEVSAEVVWKGRRQHIRIAEGKVTVEPGDIAFTPPRE